MFKLKLTHFQTPLERNKDIANDRTPQDSNIEILYISTPSL